MTLSAEGLEASGIWSAGPLARENRAGIAVGDIDVQSFPVSELSHVSPQGEARMVDVSHKPPVFREAVAAGEIRLAPSTLDLIESNQVAKGNVLATARIAGIMAAKRTGELIPLCHPLPITYCGVEFEIPAARDRIRITASARLTAATGVEMEALTAVCVAALTIYDMCKAVDATMVIGDVRLLSKTKSPAPPAAPASA